MKFRITKASTMLKSDISEEYVNINTIEELMEIRKRFDYFDLIINDNQIIIYDDYME